MEFGLLPGTTWDHLFHAALTKSHVPLRDPSGGTVWYATAKAVAPLFTLHGVWYLETQNATYELVGISVPEKVRVKQFLKDVLRLVRWRLGF